MGFAQAPLRQMQQFAPVQCLHRDQVENRQKTVHIGEHIKQLRGFCPQAVKQRFGGVQCPGFFIPKPVPFRVKKIDMINIAGI